MRPSDPYQYRQTHAPQGGGVNPPARESAANLIRGQLDAIYSTSQSPQPKVEETAPAPTQTQPQPQANQMHTGQTTAPSIDPDEWKKYHTSWQDYYQKYYQSYYTGYARKVINEHKIELEKRMPETTIGQATDDKKQELEGLRNKLVEKARNSATKARGSRHFIPVAAAVCVVMVFAFLQYNRVLFSNVQAYISPGAISPQNIIVDPNSDVAVGPEPKLIIPKLNINVPVVYGVGADDKSQLAAMENGVAHWPGSSWASSVPGQVGNTVIAGHSSNDLFETGDYKFIFAQLEMLEKGDTMYMHYEGKRYTYSVTQKDIIEPTGAWQNVIVPTDKPKLVLVTCWPLGTADKRLLVTTEQISPDPATAKPAEVETETDTVPVTNSMTGNSPTFIERILGLFS